MTAITGKCSGMKRDVSEVVCHYCKKKGNYANKCPANKPLPEDTTTKYRTLLLCRTCAVVLFSSKVDGVDVARV